MVTPRLPPGWFCATLPTSSLNHFVPNDIFVFRFLVLCPYAVAVVLGLNVGLAVGWVGDWESFVTRCDAVAMPAELLTSLGFCADLDVFGALLEMLALVCGL